MAETNDTPILDDSAPEWLEEVPRLESRRHLTGGIDGTLNVAPRVLAKRTRWLKNQLALAVQAASQGLADHVAAADPHGDRAFAAGLVAALKAQDIGNVPAETGAPGATVGESLGSLQGQVGALNTTIMETVGALNAEAAARVAADDAHVAALDPHGDRAYTDGKFLVAYAEFGAALDTKQAALVSGENIATINGQNLLLGGNLTAGLVHFAESEIIVAPANRAYEVLAAVPSATAHAGIALKVVGYGSFVVGEPENGLRGDYAVDFQRLGATGALMASGSNSVLLGTNGCAASGNNAVAIGSQSSTASGTNAGIYHGYNCIASGAWFSSGRAVFVGEYCTASGANAAIIGSLNYANASGSRAVIIASDGGSASGTGSVNICANGAVNSGINSVVMAGWYGNASGQNSVVMGTRASDRGMNGAYAKGAYNDTAAQVLEQHLVRRTTDAMPTKMNAFGFQYGFEDVLDRAWGYAVDNGQCIAFTAKVSIAGCVAGDGTQEVFGGFIIKGVVRRLNFAPNTIALVGAPTIESWLDAAIGAATVTLSPDNVYGCLHFIVQGVAGYELSWHAVIEGSEVKRYV